MRPHWKEIVKMSLQCQKVRAGMQKCATVHIHRVITNRAWHCFSCSALVPTGSVLDTITSAKLYLQSQQLAARCFQCTFRRGSFHTAWQKCLLDINSFLLGLPCQCERPDIGFYGNLVQLKNSNKHKQDFILQHLILSDSLRNVITAFHFK